MPDLDLKPTEYREKRRFFYRVTHASRGQLWIATMLGIWAGAFAGLRGLGFEPFVSVPGGWPSYLTAIGPAVLYIGWFAITD